MALSIQAVPAAHPYSRHIRPLPGSPDASAGLRWWDDPAVPGAPAGQWWPHGSLDPSWLTAHRPDVLHVHFGFEHLTPAELRAVLDTQHAHGGAVVTTVHDLDNPHLADQAPHHERLAILLGEADAALTLTPGAAAAIRDRWGRDVEVVPHPHILGLDELAADPGAAAQAFHGGAEGGKDDAGPVRLVLHGKDLRPQVDPLGVLPAAAASAARLRDEGHDVELVVEIQDRVRDEAARDALRRRTAELGVRLWEHPRLPDPELHRLLARDVVSVLPYRRGTHSGWVEMCRDLGTPVAVADIGFIGQQARAWDGPDQLATFDADDADSVHTALAGLVARRGEARPASRTGRARQRADIARRHAEIYRAVARG